MSKPGRPRKERYARLMGGFWRNPKVRRLSLEARGLLATAWSYAADQATDGRVPLELIGAWAGKRERALMSELSGFLVVEDIDAIAHDWTDVNITADEWERKLEADRNRKRNGREFPVGFPPGNGGGNPSGDPDHFQHGAQTKTKTKTLLERDNSPDARAPVPYSARIRELESRYPEGKLAEARRACALSRRNGKLADSVWLTVLEKLAASPVDAVVRSVDLFCERYADGSKDERYLLGIVRGELKPKRSNGTARLPPGTGEGWSTEDIPLEETQGRLSHG